MSRHTIDLFTVFSTFDMDKLGQRGFYNASISNCYYFRSWTIIFCYKTCKGISFPMRKEFMTYWPLSVGTTWNKNWGFLAVFVAQRKNTLAKTFYRTANFLNFNYGGDILQPSNSRKCQLTKHSWICFSDSVPLYLLRN